MDAADSRSTARLAAWVEEWPLEDPATEAARGRAREIGIPPVSPVAGAALRVLAALTQAHAVAEVGTGTGVSALWLLRGMRPDGVLTTIDTEAEHQRLARLSLNAAGVPSGRVRLIQGRAADVLPRLADAAYDLVHLDGAATDLERLLEEALRLLRPGGVVAVSGLLADGRVADPEARDPASVARRTFAGKVREDERLVPVLLPVGDGLLVALRADQPS